jgi:tetratricopeptide (TPR) repeat protein
MLLFGLVLGTFLPALQNGFLTFDDARYITANDHVRSGLTRDNVKWAFQTFHASNWHPLTWLSHMTDCQLFGLNPRGHHLTSVLLHAVNTVLVFLVLRSMTGAWWRSLFVAAVFGLHPLRVESVAWAAERKDVLSTLFWMLTLGTYGRYVRKAEGGGQRTEDRGQKTEYRGQTSDLRPPTSVFRPLSSGYYWLALLFFALGLMSKPMLVTLPLVLLLLDYWPFQRVMSLEFRVSSWSRLALEKGPFLALAALSCVVTFIAQKPAMIWMAEVPLLDRLKNALIAYWRYLGRLFWPAKLSVLYPGTDWPVSLALVALVALVGVSFWALVLRRRAPYFFTGWFWFIGTLVPAIGLVAVGEQSMADRYTYIPSIGVLLALVWGAHDVSQRWRWGTAAFGAAAAGAALLCIPVTRHNLGYWKDTETLFRHAIQVTERSYRACVNLGGDLFNQGRVDEALRCFQQAVSFRPDSAESHGDLGVALHAKNRSAEAISEYREALRLKPDYAAAHFNLGIVLEESGQLEQSIQEFQQAAGLDRNALFYRHLGEALAHSGRVDEAIVQLQQAVGLDRGDAVARDSLGEALRRQGRVEEAAAQFKEALMINPEDGAARSNLNAILDAKGR